MILMAFEVLAISICCAIFFVIGFQCGKSNQKMLNNRIYNNQLNSTEFDNDLSKILNYTGDCNSD